MPALIPLVRRTEILGYAIVDDADLEHLSVFRWTLNPYGYAVRRLPRPAQRYVTMHRELLGLERGDARVGDHVNRNRLDNRRANLRILERRQHNHNMSAHRDGTSPHRGVCWSPRSRKWRATAQLDGVWHHLGLFEDEQEAALVAAAWRAEHMDAAA